MIDAAIFLAALPGKRVTASSNGVTVADVLRSARRFDPKPQTVLYFPSLSFGGVDTALADLIHVDSVPCIVTAVDHLNEDTITRAAVLVLSGAVSIDGQNVACEISDLTRDTMASLGGWQTNDTETVITHTGLLPEGMSLPSVGDAVTMSDGRARFVSTISSDATGKMITVTLKAQGGEA